LWRWKRHVVHKMTQVPRRCETRRLINFTFYGFVENHSFSVSVEVRTRTSPEGYDERHQKTRNDAKTRGSSRRRRKRANETGNKCTSSQTSVSSAGRRSRDRTTSVSAHEKLSPPSTVRKTKLQHHTRTWPTPTKSETHVSPYKSVRTITSKNTVADTNFFEGIRNGKHERWEHGIGQSSLWRPPFQRCS
jgi:hypothetical protein